MKKIIALLLSLVLLSCCLIACDNGGGDSTEAPKTAVIEVYDADGNIFLRDKEFEVTEGMNVRQAIEALCADRGYTVVFDATGAFQSFTSDGEGDEKVTIEGKQVPNADGTVNAYFLTWKYNGTDMGLNVPADTVLKVGDTVTVCFSVEENVEPSN